MKLPQRPNAHKLERDSINYFESHLPGTWCTTKPSADYGVDLTVEIFDGDNASGRELLVQLKASHSSDMTADGSFERIILNVSTYNMLRDKLQVVMLVKYLRDEDCAYWQLLGQVDPPNQSNETMTVRIPRVNTFSEECWEKIRRYVEQIHLGKLGRRERIDFESFI